MAIHKLKKHQDAIPYCMLSRDVIQGIDNIDALGIWAYLQSQSDNWDVVEDHLRNKFNLGRARYMAAMKALREAGLYEVVRVVKDGRYVGSYFHIYAIQKDTTSTEFHKCEIPQVRNSIRMENSTYIKEKEINKEKESNKKKENKPAPNGLVANTPFEQELIDYRKAIKKPLKTQRGLTGLINSIEKTAKAWNISKDLVATHMMQKEWQSIEPDYQKPFAQPQQFNHAKQQTAKDDNAPARYITAAPKAELDTETKQAIDDLKNIFGGEE